MSSSSSPCAACKFLRRKCTTDCVFSPYFPADNPKRFADVHKVFGASNVAKILNDIDISHREDAVQSLAYEANARIEDPVYGCVGQISHMQKTVSNLHMRLEEGKKELASLVGPTAMFQMLQDPVPRAHYNIMAASSTMLGLDRQQQYRLQQEQYHRQQQQQQQQIGAHIMHQWMQQSERQQQHLQMTLQQPHQQGGDSGGGGGQLVIRERQQHKEQLLERQMQVREQHNQVHGGQVVIRDATAQLQQINSQEQDQLVVALQVKEEQEMFRSVEEMHQQAQMEVIRQQREVELMRLQEQQFRHMEARGRGGGGEGPSGTAELSPLLALGTGFNAMNPYHVQQQEQQQQEEIHDIQLFSDPNLHPPEPENGG